MITFANKISKNYAFEISFFHKVRKISDGIDFFEFSLNINLFKGNHNPSCCLTFEIFNYSIIDFQFYNIHHIKEED